MTGLGDARVNSSIGSQWRARVKDLDDIIMKHAENMTLEELESLKINIDLNMI